MNITQATFVMSGRYEMRIQIIGSNKVEKEAMAKFRIDRDSERSGLTIKERVAMLEDESTETLLAVSTMIHNLTALNREEMKESTSVDTDELEARIEALEKQVNVLLQLYGGKNV